MSRDEFAEIGSNKFASTPSPQFEPNAANKTGSTINILVKGIGAALAEECDDRSESRAGAVLVATASGEDLDRAILEHSQGRLPRLGARAASIHLAITRSSTGGGVVEAGTEVLAGGLVWTTDDPVVFGAGALGPLPVTATCAALGLVGNGVPKGQQRFRSLGALFDASLVVESTHEASAGGEDRETDGAYRARYEAWDAGLDRDTDQIARGALAVPGVATAIVIEDVDVEGNPTGIVTLYVADASGRASKELLARVRVASREFRLLGQSLRILGMAPDMQDFTVSIGALEGYALDSVQNAARYALVSYVNSLLPGASLLRANLAKELQKVPGLVLLPSAPYGVTSPGVDLAQVPSKAFRTTPDRITFA
jgi:uncharacterized phage protein gp47/JayE